MTVCWYKKTAELYCLCGYKEKTHTNVVVSVKLCAKKMYILSNDHGRTRQNNFFPTENIFFGEIWSKKKSCQFKLTFNTYTNSNMQNLMLIFNFSVLTKFQSFLLKVTLVPRLIQNTFFRKIQKFKIASLSLNLVHKLIQIYGIQWWWLFLF